MNYLSTRRRRTPTMVRVKSKSGRSRPATATKRARSSPAVLNIQSVPIDAIDWSFSIRPISMDHVDRLAAATQLPPIKVWQFQAGKYRGIDGYHRWHLAKARGDKAIETIICRFSQTESGERAFEFECIRSNLQHGLPLTRHQRDRAIARIWNRWGRAAKRSKRGITLDQLGKLFNLTKARIHQIVSSTSEFGSETDLGPLDEHGPNVTSELDARGHLRPFQAHPGGFSSFGRFSSATVRLSRLLADDDFIGKLLHEGNPEVLRVLVRLRALIDHVVIPKSSSQS